MLQAKIACACWYFHAEWGDYTKRLTIVLYRKRKWSRSGLLGYLRNYITFRKRKKTAPCHSQSWLLGYLVNISEQWRHLKLVWPGSPKTSPSSWHLFIKHINLIVFINQVNRINCTNQNLTQISNKNYYFHSYQPV